MVLDEATAAIDTETDTAIQQTLRGHFQQCTILTIAHRLDTIMDSDRILVLSDGRVIEYDTPLSLLNNPHSAFRSMVYEAGDTIAAQMMTLATTAYQQRRMKTTLRKEE